MSGTKEGAHELAQPEVPQPDDNDPDNSSRLAHTMNDLALTTPITPQERIKLLEGLLDLQTSHRSQAIQQRNILESPLLRLPAEVRNIIWKHVIRNERINRSRSRHDDQEEEGYLSLLSVCRQIYLETRLLPFNLNIFYMCTGRRSKNNIDKVLSRLVPAQRNAILSIFYDTLISDDEFMICLDLCDRKILTKRKLGLLQTLSSLCNVYINVSRPFCAPYENLEELEALKREAEKSAKNELGEHVNIIWTTKPSKVMKLYQGTRKT